MRICISKIILLFSFYYIILRTITAKFCLFAFEQTTAVWIGTRIPRSTREKSLEILIRQCANFFYPPGTKAKIFRQQRCLCFEMSQFFYHVNAYNIFAPFQYSVYNNKIFTMQIENVELKLCLYYLFKCVCLLILFLI